MIDYRKYRMPWRVVTRDENDKIIEDIPVEHFAEGEPVYESKKEALASGHELTLQAGIRIVKRHPPRC